MFPMVTFPLDGLERFAQALRGLFRRPARQGG